MMPTPGVPSVFISYSHADKPVGQAIASRLDELGARVWIDEGELRVGDSIIERIATAISEVHFVVAIVSANSVASPWCRKELSLAVSGGLGREGVKVLPLRLGDVEMPASLADVYYLPVDPKNPQSVADELFRDAESHLADQQTDRGPIRPPATRSANHGPHSVIGDPWADVQATGFGLEIVAEARRTGITPADYAQRRMAGEPPWASCTSKPFGPTPIAQAGPITLIGIVREGVGRPRGDATRGSALYKVPFRLSRTPTSEWARHLQRTWDRPPEFTPMHRPGIARVAGDVVTLDGVTIEEVERYHLKTLKLCIGKVNQDVDQHERDQAAAVERERTRIQEHNSLVNDVVRRLNFE